MVESNDSFSSNKKQRPFIIYNSYKPNNLQATKEYFKFILTKRFILPNLLEETEIDPIKFTKQTDYSFTFLPQGFNNMLAHLKLEKRKRKNTRMISYLCFDSMFECGNLNKVVAISPNEYDLYLNTDTNCLKQSQWFYFSVANTRQNAKVKFNIKNIIKYPHFYQKGMKPLVFSEKDNKNIYATWTYHVDNVILTKSYLHKLHDSFDVYLNGNEEQSNVQPDICYDLSFTHMFKHEGDKVYFAYNRPYSFIRLNNFLEHIESQFTSYKKSTPWILPEILINKDTLYYKREILCHSLGGLPVYCITITNNETAYKENTKHVIITSRVHSSETAGSYKTQGILKFLISNNPISIELRKELVFVIVPMLNPDGVVIGNNRCSLGGYDLNRCWSNPCVNKQPTIFAIKRKLYDLVSQGREIFVYCDLHGHSKLLNSFIYACSKVSNSSPCLGERVRLLPRVLACRCHLFNYHQCSFKVEHDKLNTARVVIWKEFKVTNSFTMESSVFAYVLGREVVVFQERDYERLGEALINALHQYMKLIESMQAEFIDDKECLKPGKLAKMTGILAADKLRLEIEEDKAEERKRRLRSTFKIRAQKLYSIPKEANVSNKTPLVLLKNNNSPVKTIKRPPSKHQSSFDHTKVQMNSSSEFSKGVMNLNGQQVSAIQISEPSNTIIKKEKSKRQVVLQKIKTELKLDLENKESAPRVESAMDGSKPNKNKSANFIILKSSRHSLNSHYGGLLIQKSTKQLHSTTYSRIRKTKKNISCNLD